MGMLAKRMASKSGIPATASIPDSVNTMPWYHGTKSPAKISNFRIGRRGAAYFTEEIGNARVYGPHIFEVDLNVKKVWNFKNPEDIAAIMPALRSMPNYEPWMEKELRIGDWEILEMRPVQESLRSNGYDSYFVSGDGQSIGVLDRSAISVARDFWVDRLGEEVPKEEAMGAEASLGITAASDAEYLAAVESGDMAKAQAMVDQAARAAGYNIGPVYHVTDAEFNVFDIDKGRKDADVQAMYFSSGSDAWASMGGRIMAVFLKIQNPYTGVRRMTGKDNEGVFARKELMSKGFDGMIGEEEEDAETEYAVFSPDQIKSADPVTYDDAGKVIPLSKRFNSASNDIRANKAQRHTMNLQERYKALKAAGMISATGRTEEIIAEDDWVRVKRMAVPEIDADSYIFTECKRETAVCIVRYVDGKYLMRNEATLQSNFTPAPKVMTETLEEGETAEQAATRGLLEEFNGAPVEPLIYLGSINGTFQELHNYHIYLVEGIEPPAADDLIGAGEGDGSRGEERSGTINITEEEWAQVKDFISWIAYGMMKQYDNRNILGRALCR